MTKNRLERLGEIIDLTERKEITDKEGPNIVFVPKDTKAAWIYKNVPCEVVEKNYRYILKPKTTENQNSDFLSIFEDAVLTSRVLKESSNSKIVFVIDSSYIFSGRGREFTLWLESVNKAFGSSNVLESSCLIIESVSRDSDPIIEIKSLMQDSCGRISEVNLKLLDRWVADGKILLMNNFTKKDLGEYNGASFQTQLDDILHNCNPVSHLSTKPFLLKETIDSQRAIYTEINDHISKKSKEFIEILKHNLASYLQKSASDDDLNQFEKTYQTIAFELAAKKEHIYEYMLHFSRINIKDDSESLLKIANDVKSLEKIKYKIRDLMPDLSHIYASDVQELNFLSELDTVKLQLRNVWNQDLSQIKEAEDTYLKLCELFVGLNEYCKLYNKELGVKLYLSKRDMLSNDEMQDFVAHNPDFRSDFSKLSHILSHRDNQLTKAFFKTIKGHSELTIGHQVIYQSIMTSIDQNESITDVFANLYMKHIKDCYAELYLGYNETITNLEQSYKDCINQREGVINKLKVGTGVAGLAGVGGGAVMAMLAESVAFGAITGIPLPLISIGAGLVTGGVSFGVHKYQKALVENPSINIDTKLLSFSFDPVEKYYKQLPKDLREMWSNINTPLQLSEYLKNKYPENKIYQLEEEGAKERKMDPSNSGISHASDINHDGKDERQENKIVSPNDGEGNSGNNGAEVEVMGATLVTPLLENPSSCSS